MESYDFDEYGVSDPLNFVTPQKVLYILAGLVVIRIIIQIAYVIKQRRGK